MMEKIEAYVIDYFYEDIVIVKVRKIGVSDVKDHKRIIGEAIVSRVDGVNIGDPYDDLYPINRIHNRNEIIDKIFKHI